jgi:catechol 2,3-dioxygenase-like lactoylglutathione lyase family enzyme
MLKDSTLTAIVPATDLGRARSFYADKLGLTPSQELPGGLFYGTGPGTSFLLYETRYPSGDHTVARWHVDDVAAEVAELKSRGVAFEHYDMPGAEWDGDVASIGGLGSGAWFKDSEGNVLGIDDIGA